MKIEASLLELKKNTEGIYKSYLFGYKSNIIDRKKLKMRNTLETLRKKVNSAQKIIRTMVKNEEKQ